MTTAEFAKLLGVEVPRVLKAKTSYYQVPYEEHHHHHHHSSGSDKVTPLKQSYIAESINWFEKGAVDLPKDQAVCGSCWAFTTVGTLEALAHISGKFKDIPNFSMQQLLDCDLDNDGCDGGWMYKAYKYTSQNGIMYYDDYPYKGVSDHEKCLYNKTRTAFKNGGMVQEKNLRNNELKAILNKQPVGVGIYTNGNF
jgi:C1A family cysteine protease